MALPRLSKPVAIVLVVLLLVAVILLIVGIVRRVQTVERSQDLFTTLLTQTRAILPAYGTYGPPGQNLEPYLWGNPAVPAALKSQRGKQILSPFEGYPGIDVVSMGDRFQLYMSVPKEALRDVSKSFDPRRVKGIEQLVLCGTITLTPVTAADYDVAEDIESACEDETSSQNVAVFAR